MFVNMNIMKFPLKVLFQVEHSVVRGADLGDESAQLRPTGLDADLVSTILSNEKT